MFCYKAARSMNIQTFFPCSSVLACQPVRSLRIVVNVALLSPVNMS
ncbi:hypothetical protein EC036_07080 [Enterobacter cloacae]|uniref:Uncharacterized protein n=1 Tax=Enterobacter cloacae subsp. cloacae (strain ATCC 13047 / DSM 30054 / NBRC 13535 / NCTC 10005 / WDCM 00083 / NCDC 279-56) TaxID=716541 RepID=A0A0H3CGM0_ENTCC|nr:hypothetical protein ECL_00877 [Enterobacter cloacae subsp. cloacae ATCC 13047]AIV28355.1 hypothetical protein EC036_07080 [Enterobacter cloacae]